MPNPNPPVRRRAIPVDDLPPGGSRRRSGTAYQLRTRDAAGARVYRYARTAEELWTLYHGLGAGDVAAPAAVDERRLDLAAYTERVIEARIRSGRLRERSADAYRGAFASMIGPRLGRRRLASLTRRDVDQLRDELEARPELSRTSVRYALQLLRTILRQAVRDRVLAVNVAADVELPEREAYVPNVPDPDQLVAFLEATAEDPLAPLWTLAATTGMRRGELLALRWRDVDLEAGRLRIGGTLHRGDRVGPTKTASSRRTLGLDPGAVRQLRRIGPGAPEAYVFARRNGRPIATTTLARELERAIAGAGLEPFQFHDLRHAFATAAIEAEVDIYAVSQILGHSRIDMTADLYGHLTERASAEAVLRVGDRLLRSGQRATLRAVR